MTAGNDAIKPTHFAGVSRSDGVGPFGDKAYFDPELPWGCWLRLEGAGRARRYVDDATGRTFLTLRSALWNGRLGMPDSDGGTLEDLLRILKEVLSASASGSLDCGLACSRLFDKSVTAMSWFTLWLASMGLTEPDEYRLGGWTPTGEGLSVLRMLEETELEEARDRPLLTDS